MNEDPCVVGDRTNVYFAGESFVKFGGLVRFASRLLVGHVNHFYLLGNNILYHEIVPLKNVFVHKNHEKVKKCFYCIDIYRQGRYDSKKDR